MRRRWPRRSRALTRRSPGRGTPIGGSPWGGSSPSSREQLGDMEKVFSGHLHAFGAFMVQGAVEPAELRARDRRPPSRTSSASRFSFGTSRGAAVMRALQAGRLDEAEQLIEREGVARVRRAGRAHGRHELPVHGALSRVGAGSGAGRAGGGARVARAVRGRVPDHLPVPLHAREPVQRGRRGDEGPG